MEAGRPSSQNSVNEATPNAKQKYDALTKMGFGREFVVGFVSFLQVSTNLVAVFTKKPGDISNPYATAPSGVFALWLAISSAYCHATMDHNCSHCDHEHHHHKCDGHHSHDHNNNQQSDYDHSASSQLLLNSDAIVPISSYGTADKAANDPKEISYLQRSALIGDVLGHIFESVNPSSGAFQIFFANQVNQFKPAASLSINIVFQLVMFAFSALSNVAEWRTCHTTVEQANGAKASDHDNHHLEADLWTSLAAFRKGYNDFINMYFFLMSVIALFKKGEYEVDLENLTDVPFSVSCAVISLLLAITSGVFSKIINHSHQNLATASGLAHDKDEENGCSKGFKSSSLCFLSACAVLVVNNVAPLFMFYMIVSDHYGNNNKSAAKGVLGAFTLASIVSCSSRFRTFAEKRAQYFSKTPGQEQEDGSELTAVAASS